MGILMESQEGNQALPTAPPARIAGRRPIHQTPCGHLPCVCGLQGAVLEHSQAFRVSWVLGGCSLGYPQTWAAHPLLSQHIPVYLVFAKR